jgi:hypothetical protein
MVGAGVGPYAHDRMVAGQFVSSILHVYVIK